MKKADRKKERFRNEWKYLISTSEKEVLNLRMKPLMKLDPHAENGGYLIRSPVSYTCLLYTSSYSVVQPVYKFHNPQILHLILLYYPLHTNAQTVYVNQPSEEFP